jgi:hypothetical protein
MKSVSLAAIAATVLLSCLALTKTATASSNVDFSNSRGTLSGTSAGMTLSGSKLIAVTGLNGGGTITGKLGSVSYSTGALMSGSLQAGGTFAAGGTFTVDGNGTNGIPNGLLFSGAFSGPVTWTLFTLQDGTHNYTLSGVVTGTMNGAPADGTTVQLTINTGTALFSGRTKISSGNTVITSAIPEPSSLVLFLTGGLSVLGTMRRKLLGQQTQPRPGSGEHRSLAVVFPR